MNIKVIIGLGNPGKEYDGSRHNIGSRVVSHFCLVHNGVWKQVPKLKSSICILKEASGGVILVRPNVYMNDNGAAVLKVCQFYKIQAENVIIIYDDISFDVGDYRITPRSGTAGHNGMKDVLSKLGSGFIRFRIGIGAKHNSNMDLKDHVLGRFTEDEEEIIASMLPKILCDLQLLLDKGVEYSMNLINRKKNYGR